jgi:hypothetical protein
VSFSHITIFSEGSKDKAQNLWWVGQFRDRREGGGELKRSQFGKGDYDFDCEWINISGTSELLNDSRIEDE